MAVGGATRHQLTGLVGGLQFPALVSLTVCWLGRFPSPAPSMARVRWRGAPCGWSSAARWWLSRSNDDYPILASLCIVRCFSLLQLLQ